MAAGRGEEVGDDGDVEEAVRRGGGGRTARTRSGEAVTDEGEAAASSPIRSGSGEGGGEWGREWGSGLGFAGGVDKGRVGVGRPAGPLPSWAGQLGHSWPSGGASLFFSSVFCFAFLLFISLFCFILF